MQTIINIKAAMHILRFDFPAMERKIGKLSSTECETYVTCAIILGRGSNKHNIDIKNIMRDSWVNKKKTGRTTLDEYAIFSRMRR